MSLKHRCATIPSLFEVHCLASVDLFAVPIYLVTCISNCYNMYKV